MTRSWMKSKGVFFQSVIYLYSYYIFLAALGGVVVGFLISSAMGFGDKATATIIITTGLLGLAAAIWDVRRDLFPT